MSAQHLLWIAIPSGRVERDGVEFLKLALVVAPRLTPARSPGSLFEFPDWLEWTRTASRITSFEVEVQGGPTIRGRRSATQALDVALWPLLFAPSLKVDAFRFDDYSDRTIIGFPAADLASQVQRQYQSLVFDSANSLPSVEALVQSLSGFAVELSSDLRERLHGDQRAEQAEQPRDTRERPRPQRLDAAEAVGRALLFHEAPSAHAPDLPEPGPELEALFDFHKAVAQLGDHPALLRRLGLVLEIEFPADELARFSATAAPLRLRARPHWRPDVDTETLETALWVAFSWDGATFALAPHPAAVPEHKDGLLNLPADEYELLQFDVDGAVLKLAHTATSLKRSLSRRAPDAPSHEGPPALRSGGLALVRRERSSRLHSSLGRAALENAALERGDSVATLFAEDLTRGFVVDIWDSLSGAWHSLCRRVGSYVCLRGPLEFEIEDEGFVQTAVSEAAPKKGILPSGDLRLHEILWAWAGWSLVAPRPGKTLLSGAGSEDEPARVPNQSQTPLALEATFRAAPRSLPRLRYGARYRLRARPVDLAGGVSALASAAETSAVPAGEAQPYLRFEPVDAPTLILREALNAAKRPGETLDRLVIRARNAAPALDVTPTTEKAERHLVPPRTSVQTSELHGMLDSPAGRVAADAGTYELLRERDAVKLDAGPDGAPIHPEESLTTPFLPDPLARGAALRNLPNVPEGSLGEVDATGQLVFRALPGASVRPGNATLIPFSAQPAWPDLRAFRVELVEGNAAPVWDAEGRRLVVALAKAEAIDVPLSCFVEPADLGFLGVWAWLRDVIEGRAVLDGKDPKAMRALGIQVAHVAQYALEGGLWALTPARSLRLVHAVQQPLAAPSVELVAARKPAATATQLQGEIRIHGKSTGSLDLYAAWTERVDALSEAGPRTLSATDHVDTVPIRELTRSILRNGERPVGEYLPSRDVVSCNADAHPRHEFGDTRHRLVRYRIDASSRFSDCFDAAEPGGFTRSSGDVLVDVPSSARPAVPQIEYVIPTFGWQSQTQTNLIASVRQGRGLRVYLKRPWFSSGDGELLGVVVRRSGLPAPSDLEREALKPSLTQWGADPLWGAPALPALPTRLSFPKSVLGADSLSLPELAGEAVAVAGHEVGYDEERQRWFCDIEIDTGAAYYPFVRLALARYQPSAISGCHLSPVVLTAFAQVAPDRTLIVSYDAHDPQLLHVVVSGFSYQSELQTKAGVPVEVRSGSELEVQVESRVAGLSDELAWTPSTAAVITPLAVERGGAVLWRGTVRLPAARLPKQIRIVAREFETHEGSTPARHALQPFAFESLVSSASRVRRLVYADGIVV